MKKFFGKIGAFCKKHKVWTIIVSCFIGAIILVFPILFFAFQAKVPAYDGADRMSEGYVPTAADVANVQKYEHVVIFGVDGAGAYFKEGVTPQFDRIFGSGSKTFEGISQRPTSSGENWAAMFTGKRVQTHKINNYVSFLFPNTRHDTFFKVYHKNHKDATFFSACNWMNINYGIIENGCKVKKVNCKPKAGAGAERIEVDEVVKNEALKRLQKYDDAIFYMHFDAVDHAGHEEGGYASPKYVERLKTVDGYIGEVYDACIAKGWGDNTLFICVSDHGHTFEGGHGGETDEEKNITFAVAGAHDIQNGTMGKMVTQDVASVVLYALGEVQPDSYESKVPSGIFISLAKYE